MSVDLCRIVEMPSFTDQRGSLSFAEESTHVPFAIRRIYYLYNVMPNSSRGAHAHKALHQFMIAISGRFDVLLDDGENTKTIHLDNPSQGLYICPMIWRDLSNFSSHAVCLVLASELFDEMDYVRNYDSFMDQVRCK